MNSRRLLLFLLLIIQISLGNAHGQAYELVKKEYLNLRFEEGNAILVRELGTSHVQSIRLTALRDFLQVLLVQTDERYSKFLSKSDYWHGQLKSINPLTGEAAAGLVEASLYRAVLASQFSDYRESARALIQAYKDLIRNQLIVPPRDWSRLSGIMGFLFQQVPDQAAKFLKVAGIKPSRLDGLSGLEKFYRESVPGSADRIEGYLLLVTALKEFSQDPEKAWLFVVREGASLDENPLVRYQQALSALKAGYVPEAIKRLEIRPGSFTWFPTWKYQLGRCYQLAGDSRAGSQFSDYLGTRGIETYLHSARLRLAWSQLLAGERERASESWQAVLNLPEPRTVSDRQALREASEGTLPDVDLLRIRLLYDGGDYKGCLDACSSVEKGKELSPEKLGELQYRRGRCYQRLNRLDEAIGSFERVLIQKDRLKSYLVPNSALQIGLIHKEKGQEDLARKYLQMCLDLNRYGYREGIRRQAEAALRTLN